MNKQWKPAIYRPISLIILAVMLCLVFDLILPLVLIIFVPFFIFQLIEIYRLKSWVSEGCENYPATGGIWEDIYLWFYKNKKREHKRKKKLLKKINLYRKLTSALPDALIVLGPNDEIEWSNQEARSVLGLQFNDKGLRITDLVRSPFFINYIENRNYSKPLIIPSPVEKGVELTIRVICSEDDLKILTAQNFAVLNSGGERKANSLEVTKATPQI